RFTRDVTLGTAGGTINVTGTAWTVDGNIGGPGRLTVTGNQVLSLGGTNFYGGGTVINGGVLAVQNDGNLGVPTAPLTISGNGFLTLNDAITSSRALTVGAPGGTIVTGNADVELTGTRDGA